jgi:hypothetical protein
MSKDSLEKQWIQMDKIDDLLEKNLGYLLHIEQLTEQQTAPHTKLVIFRYTFACCFCFSCTTKN